MAFHPELADGLIQSTFGRTKFAGKNGMDILTLFFTVLPFVVAFLVAFLLCTLAVLFINSAPIAMGTMTVIFLIETSLLAPFALNFGIWVYLPDLLMALLLPAICFRLILLKKFDAIPRVWLGIGLLWMGLFAWGVIKYGTIAGVDFRSFFYIWLGAAYLATFDYDEAFARSLTKLFIVIGVGVCIVACYRWVAGAVDYEFYRELQKLDTTDVAFHRVVAAGPTFILACSLLVLVQKALNERFSPIVWFLALMFGITVVAMQHRSVWAALFAGLVALVLAVRQMRAGAESKVFAMVFAGIVLVTIIVVSGRFQGVVDSVEQQAVRAVSTTGGTFVGRVVDWQVLLKNWAGSISPTTYLIGKPFGSSFERDASGPGNIKINYAPHNFYVQLLYRGGLVGLIAFLWVYVQATRALWSRLKRKQDVISPVLFAMMVAQLVYFIPYGIEYSQMLLIGLLLGVINSERNRPKAPESNFSRSSPIKRLGLGA